MKVNLQRLLDLTHTKELILGRKSHGIDLDHSTVSKRHVLIEQSERREFRITDLNSKNGLRVNGRKTKTSVLKSGDEVRLGALVLIVELEEAPDKDEIIHGVSEWIRSSPSIRKRLGWFDV